MAENEFSQQAAGDFPEQAEMGPVHHIADVRVAKTTGGWGTGLIESGPGVAEPKIHHRES